MERIFVSIPSYRDTECQHTVHDLFSKADHPERIFVGICWQYDREADRDCFAVPAPYPTQVRTLNYPYYKSQGACWARAQAMALWQGEEYILLIDAHMRFVRGWDSILIDTLKRCPPRAALSTTLPGYRPSQPPADLSGYRSFTFVNRVWRPGELQPVHLSGSLHSVREVPLSKPALNAFCVSNFVFAPALMFQEVPLDPHIYFWGDELAYSARVWTHGWDIYQLEGIVAYHYWETVKRGEGEGQYKTPNAQALLAYQRVLHVLGRRLVRDPAALTDIEKYGMGTARALREYWGFAGIDLERRIVEKYAAEGRWTLYSRAA